MPTPRKIDLLPEEIRDWLREEFVARGFGDIEDVTEALNARLEDAGLQLTIGKSAVGRFSKALKDQREAFSIAETLLSDLDIEAEGELHKVLMQMIATSAVHMIHTVREEDGHLDPKDLMALGRMLKDLMASSGMREKLLAGERERIERATREKAADEMEAVAREGGLSDELIQNTRKRILGIQ
ncbi:MAG: phage protein Gp27 family protein [Pseudomonadota bacterium]|nr:phage protein Gp27 family protein [Pseudomonadota bacterium]